MQGIIPLCFWIAFARWLNDVEHLFIHFLVIPISSLEKCPFKFFDYLFIYSLLFFKRRLNNIFYYIFFPIMKSVIEKVPHGLRVTPGKEHQGIGIKTQWEEKWRGRIKTIAMHPWKINLVFRNSHKQAKFGTVKHVRAPSLAGLSNVDITLSKPSVCHLFFFSLFFVF